MTIAPQSFDVRGLSYEIRSAQETDAAALSALRVQIDAETEYMDREPGEGFLSPEAFAEVIAEDAKAPNHLFVVACTEGKIVGFARCEGSALRRLSHQAEFGICIAKDYWRYGIGGNLLAAIIDWADANGLHKITLKVLAENERAISLYEQKGFVVEGVLRDDKRLSDGYHDTVIMGRIRKAE